MKAIDKAINTCDSAKDDFLKAINLLDQVDDIVKKYARKIDYNALYAYTKKAKEKFRYYVDNADRGWYD